jgi:hypothetical protein
MVEWRYSSIILDLSTICRWSASRPGNFTPGESATRTHWIGGWVDPRAGLDRDSNSDPSVVQPVVSRYTDWSIPPLSQ